MPATRILFVRPDHLGDILLTFPAVAALRHAMPAARITYAVRSGLESVPEHCPVVDEVIGVEFPPLARPWGVDDESLRQESQRLCGRFDAVLLTRPDDPWSAPLAASAGIPVRVGFAMPRTAPFLTHRLPVPGRRHVTDLALDTVAAVTALRGGSSGLSNASTTCLFRTSDSDEAEAQHALRDLDEERLVLLHPGSGWPLKNWPVSRWGALAIEIWRRRGTRPVVLGGVAEADVVADVVASSAGAARGLATGLSLGGLAALHRRARVVVGTDNGALHLAVMVGIPAVVLYGPSDPEMFAFRAGAPYYVVRAGLPCSPCGTLVHPPCRATDNPACVAAITVDAVLRAMEEVMR